MKFSYTVKGTTQTDKTQEEVEYELRQAAEDATDDGFHEVTEVVVKNVVVMD
jgi:hypothetical protein